MSPFFACATLRACPFIRVPCNFCSHSPHRLECLVSSFVSLQLHAGIMNSMVTITHQNRCAEMLATVRRGPFAKATPEERIEYLLTRVRKTNLSVTFADHALEHTLSSPVIVVHSPRPRCVRDVLWMF